MVHQIGTVRSDAEAGRMKYIWQVRHSGLLGLKYFVAVQGHLVRGGDAPSVKPEPSEDEDVKPSLETGGAVLRAVVDAALVGLRDQDDDVRSAGAATLIPLAAALVEQLPKKLKEVVDVLWACLGDLKDDLSSSVGGVMDLLGSLILFVPSSPLSSDAHSLSQPSYSDSQRSSTCCNRPRWSKPFPFRLSFLLVLTALPTTLEPPYPLSSLDYSPSSAMSFLPSVSPSSTPSSSSSNFPRSTTAGSILVSSA